MLACVDCAASLGRYISERAQQSFKAQQKPLEPWEKKIVDTLEGVDAPKKAK